MHGNPYFHMLPKVEETNQGPLSQVTMVGQKAFQTDIDDFENCLYSVWCSS